MKVIVCGSREWNDPWPILSELRKLPLDTTIIHGAARGADRLAGELAVGLGFAEVLAVPAQWGGKYGRGAGPARNRRMLKNGAGPGAGVPLAGVRRDGAHDTHRPPGGRGSEGVRWPNYC